MGHSGNDFWVTEYCRQNTLRYERRKCTMKAFDGHQRFVSEGEKKNNIHQKKCYWIKSWSSKISKTRPRVDVIFGRRIFAGKAGHWWSETYLSAKTSKKNWRNKNSDKLPPNALKLQVPFPLKIPTEYYMPFSEVWGHLKKWAQATGRKVIGVERDHHQILGLVSWNLFRTWNPHSLRKPMKQENWKKKWSTKKMWRTIRKRPIFCGNVGSKTLHGKSSCTCRGWNLREHLEPQIQPRNFLRSWMRCRLGNVKQDPDITWTMKYRIHTSPSFSRPLQMHQFFPSYHQLMIANQSTTARWAQKPIISRVVK